ncbi:MAG TPA: hypothetical protein VFC19_04905 [Candidatus Limnocylindrales bacterium]|nr:hypothetical protein [Candidatus Limnocylindrales bacterium]
MSTLNDAVAGARLITLLVLLIVIGLAASTDFSHPASTIANGFGWGTPDPGTIQ